VTNLLSIYMAATGTSREDAEAHFAGKGYGALKREIVDALVAELEPLQRRYAELRANPDHVHALLCESARAIQPIARRTLGEAKRAMGVGH
jgi:tryptophanyl-tRNA synthetase